MEEDHREQELEDRRDEPEEHREELEQEQEAAPEDHEDDEQGPEGQEARLLIAHGRPSQEEVDKHNIAHVPYRPWCEHCVRGKADAGGHYRRRQAHREVPEVSIDYMFLTGRGDEDDDDSGMPTIVMRDSETKIIKARIVQAKGAQPYAV